MPEFIRQFDFEFVSRLDDEIQKPEARSEKPEARSQKPIAPPAVTAAQRRADSLS
jgi:hypothetical protein